MKKTRMLGRSLLAAPFALVLPLLAAGCVGGGAGDTDAGAQSQTMMPATKAEVAPQPAAVPAPPIPEGAIAPIHAATPATVPPKDAARASEEIPPALAATAKPAESKIAAKPAAPTWRVIGTVILGDPQRSRTRAVVDVAKCFELIPAYRRLKDDHLPRTSASYLLLLAQANEDFRSAVQWIALRDGVDLVVEKGGYAGTADAVDITEHVRERLQSVMLPL